MRVHLIPVGDSIIDGLLSRPFHTLGVGDTLAYAIENTEPHRLLSRHGAADGPSADYLLRSCFTPGRDALREEIEYLRQELDPGNWPSNASAELETFTNGGRRTLDPGDVVVLLADETVRGLTSALWNALALTGGSLGRVLYKRSTSLGAVTVVPMKWTEEGFYEGGRRRLGRGLGILKSQLRKDHPDADFVVHSPLPFQIATLTKIFTSGE